MRQNRPHAGLLAVLLGSVTATGSLLAQADEAPTAMVNGGTFESVLPASPGAKQVKIASFRLDRTPVTNAQFARFVSVHPEWRRDRVARVFADAQYLSHWQSDTQPGTSIAQQPVVHVSWFAASAYCESRDMRLPLWHEWEYAAAASESEADARNDPAWRQRILAWYSKSARAALPNVGKSAPNFYGVQDLHGTVWEWVQDVSAMLVSADNREQSDPDTARFCGTGALTMEQKENYATLMRIAMLSSMQAAYTSSTMGLRCAATVERP